MNERTCKRDGCGKSVKRREGEPARYAELREYCSRTCRSIAERKRYRERNAHRIGERADARREREQMRKIVSSIRAAVRFGGSKAKHDRITIVKWGN
jgi:hypothetical protein